MIDSRAATSEPAEREDLTLCRTILETLPTAVIVLDGAGQVVLFNRAAEALLGFGARELLGKPFASHLVGCGLAELRPRIRASGDRSTRASDEPHRVLVRRSDGRVLALDASAAETRANGESVTSVILRDSSQGDQHQHILDTVRCAVIRLSTDATIRDFNHEAERIFGRTRDEVLGASCVDLLLPQDLRAAFADDLRATLDGQASGWVECRFVARDGTERVLLWNMSRVCAADGAPVELIAVGHDLTARRHAESKLRDLEADARKRRRHAEIGAIAGKIVHDIGSPLAVLMLSVEGLSRRAVENPQDRLDSAQAVIADVSAAAERIADLVRSWRAFVCGHRLALEEVDIAALLRSLAAAWRAEGSSHHVVLELSVDSRVGTVLGDRQKLARALDNIVRNALEAVTPGTGQVTVRATATSPEAISISVEDTGPGVPSGIDVFAIFETTKTNGTGLGLAIAKEFVEAHGGELTYGPAEPRGTVFRIALPRRPPPPN